MIVFSLMASSRSGCRPGLVSYQEKGSPKPFKELQPLLATPGTRQETNRSSVLALTPYEQPNVFKLTNRFDGYRHFVRRLPLLPDIQDMRADSILFSFGIDEEWAKHIEFLQFLMSGLSEIKENYLDPSIFPGFIGVQASPDDINLQHVAGADFEFNECFREKASRLHPNGNYFVQEANSDLVHDLPSSKISIHTDGLLSFVGRMTDMKDLIFVLEEFTLGKGLSSIEKAGACAAF